MFPQAFAEKMQRLLAAEYDDFCEAYQRPRNAALRLNPLKGSCTVPDFCTEAVLWEPNGYYLQADARPGLHPFHDAGAYYLQEASAMAPARLLDAQPGERVLDLCAAPGGKTTQIAAAMKQQGLLVCNEIHPKRAKVLSSNIERMAIANALVLNEHPAALAEKFPDYFDRILVDAPCSGEGMFRKEAAALADWSQETVEMCAARQREILLSAAKMLRPGGRLVYSTCTFSPEENEAVISQFLKSREDFSVERLQVPWFAPGRPDWVQAPADGLEYCFRLWPHKLRGEGHFAAVLRREDGVTPADRPTAKTQVLPKEAAEFQKEHDLSLTGGCIAFGETLFLVPEELPELKGLKVLRAGLEIGQSRKGRFTPSHALALWLKDFPQKLELSPESKALSDYLHGQTLFSQQQGWVLLCCGGLSIGWAKAAQGVLKNHYPKGLRRI